MSATERPTDDRPARADSSPVRAYLIRCWQERAAPGVAHWRFSVETVLHERQRRGFADLDALFAFLRAELDE